MLYGGSHLRCQRGSGQNWIRTSEGVSQRIYSPPRLATSVSALSLVGSRVIRRPRTTARGLSKELPPAPAGLCRRCGSGLRRSGQLAPVHDLHGAHDDALDRVVVVIGGTRAQRVEHVESPQDIAENRVLPVV